jgi:uncharacterized protein YidB (DUF937 family)
MDLFKMGQELLGGKLGDTGGLMDALSSLGGDKGFDLTAITDKLQSGGLGEQLSSWLGDGENAPVSADQITQALGADKISEFASKLGVDAGSAAQTLSTVMPALLDKLSSGGSLLDSLSSGGNPLDIARNLFK